MKKITILTLALMMIIIVVFQACKEEDDNPVFPFCEITSPENGQEVLIGETITINATAQDIGCGSISEIRFFVDDMGIGSVGNPPYTLDWNTLDAGIGSHSIKAIVYDNCGMNSSDEIEIVVTEYTGILVGSFTDPRDGQVYDTLQIGSQTWFVDNLNYEVDSSWWYNNDADNGKKYGRLYTWDAAQGACPDGWHLPTDDEWKTLESYVGLRHDLLDLMGWRGFDEGKKLKATSGWEYHGNGTNSTGFSALPAGFRDVNGDFASLGEIEAWWAATEYSVNTEQGWWHGLEAQVNLIGRNVINKDNAISVRCLKD